MKRKAMSGFAPLKDGRRRWTQDELDTPPKPADVMALIAAISPLLAGHHPSAQGAALADLLATWLAGHVADTLENSEALRRELLDLHVEKVRELVPINVRLIHGRNA